MAKKRIPTGLIEAAGRVSQAQNVFLDRSEILDPAIKSGLERKREKEANNKKIMLAANDLMQGFDSNVDYTELSEQDQKTVSAAVTGFQKTYGDAAKVAAAIEDKTSAEYQAQVDIMNSSSNAMRKLKANLDGLAGFKEEYGVNVKQNNYSMAGANSTAIAQGYIMANDAIGSIDQKGNLNWNSNEQNFNFSDYKMPFGKEKGQDAAKALGVIVDRVSRAKRELNANDKDTISRQVEDILSDPAAYASLVSDADLIQFDFSNIDPEDPEAFNKTKELIVNSIVATQGNIIAEEEKEYEDTRTTTQKNRASTYNTKKDLWDNGSIVTVQHTKNGGRLIAKKREDARGTIWEVSELNSDGAGLGTYRPMPTLTNEQFDQFFEFQI